MDLSHVDGYSLSPFGPQEYAEFNQRLRDPETWRPYNWFGFDYLGNPGVNLQAGMFGEGGVLAISNQRSAIVGQVQWIPGFWYGGANRHRAWNIGIVVLPEYRNTRAARAGTQLLINYLFEHTTAHRIELTTAPEAVAIESGIRSLGLTREGTMRKAQWREGAWRDVAMLAILREDWQLRTRTG
ncbi:RimJ/RimL family protein N-acetyltransferase [Leifsonia sp. EB41]|uniref:GNAT family N-acetyltransferase n=1 Tax=Leifsonia sp. EB41 TaxID=3156260 RepID=UPI003512DD4C